MLSNNVTKRDGVEMYKYILALMVLMPSAVFASAPSRPNNYVSNTVIDPAAVNANENTLYTYLQAGVDTYAVGSITGAAISGSAAIPYSKLSLGNSILGSDISTTANVSIGTFSVTGLTTTGSLLVGSVHQGDVLYDNGTSLVRLTPGTSGTPLVTQGASANPQYTTLSSTGVSGVFGAWNNCSGSTCADSTVYLATTDLLYLFCYSGNPNPQLTAYTDSSNPPTTVRLQPLSQATSSNETVCGTLPVRKGDYYKTTGQYAASFSFGYTIPIGS